MRFKPKVDSRKFSFRLPSTCSYVCEKLSITESAFNKACYLFTSKSLPTSAALAQAGLSRRQLVLLYKYLRVEKAFRSNPMEGICRTNAKTGSIGQMKPLPREEDDMDLYDLMLAAMNRKAASKESRIEEGRCFNIKRCNAVRFETIPAEASVRSLLFKGVFWYNPKIQQTMVSKRKFHEKLKEKVPVVHNPEDAIRLKLEAERRAAEENERRLMWYEEILVRDKVAQEKERERVLSERQRRKEARRKERAEYHKFLEESVKRGQRNRISNCELNKWASRVQHLHWVCKPALIKKLRKARAFLSLRRSVFEELLGKVPRLPPVTMPEPPRRPAFNIFSLLRVDDDPEPPARAVEELVEESEATVRRSPKPRRKKVVRGGEVTPEILLEKLKLFRGKHAAKIEEGTFRDSRRNLGGKRFAGDIEIIARSITEVYGESVTAGDEGWLRDTIVYSDYNVDTDALIEKLRLFSR